MRFSEVPVILAHGVGRVYESPLPLSLYLFGAAVTVLASFVIRALMKSDRESPERMVAGPRVAAVLGTVAQTVQVVGLLLALAFAVLEPTPGFTITPLLFWVGLIVGTTAACCILGGLWERADPWGTILGTPGGPVRLSNESRGPTHAAPGGARRTPPPPWWVGPALVYLLFWFELVSGRGFDPVAIAAVLLAYTLYRLTFGPRWAEGFAWADPLAILFGLASRVSPLRIDDRGIAYRGWLAGLAERDPMPTALFFSVFVLLGSTTLDNLRETVGWSSFLASTGLDAIPKMVLDSIALAALAVPFYLPFLACVAIAGTSESLSARARTFAWSLVPIGIAYVLAHNLPLVMVGVPGLVEAFGDRLGTEVLSGYSPSPQLVWFLEIGLIVGGHVLGVLAAHRIALRRSGSHAAALRSHTALTVLMSAFTIATLYLLSLPLVTEARHF